MLAFMLVAIPMTNAMGNSFYPTSMPGLSCAAVPVSASSWHTRAQRL
jgi:hypothetical protein